MSEFLDLLVEVGTEELPPKSLKKLAHALSDTLVAKLVDSGITELDRAKPIIYATPRRLGVRVSGLLQRQPDIEVEKRGPSLQAAYDENGKPSKAAHGFARSCGASIDDLETLVTDKGEYLLYRGTQVGQHSADLIADLLEESLKSLPIDRWMRWGKGNNGAFVRPVHWLTLLLGKALIPVKLYGIDSSNYSRGHRFHHPETLAIDSPAAYEDALRGAYVVANYAERRALVKQLAQDAGRAEGGQAVIDEALLDEVCSLVEWPCAVTGHFDEEFLQLPHEVLIASMQGHQKYFPVASSKGQLMARFITLSNTQADDLSVIRRGNERVLRARLSDAKYFWTVDCEQGLAPMAEQLGGVVFQEQLGSLADKSARIAALAVAIADEIGIDSEIAKRAATLCKADLMSLMVGEFAELQGIMGGHYAKVAGEVGEIAVAISQHYQPTFSGDQLPDSRLGQILSLADKLDTLVGIFAIGEIPTGEKDPFALRRAALGCLRLVIEKNIDLDLLWLIETTFVGLQRGAFPENTPTLVLEFMLERLRGYYDEKLLSYDEIDAVYELQPTDILDLDQRLRAISVFRNDDSAASLISADKRIRNLLHKVDAEDFGKPNPALLREPAELALYRMMESLSGEIAPLLEGRDYLAVCNGLARLKEPVDQFFDQVMVMVEQTEVKNNRLALLKELRAMFLQVADFSRLQN